MRKAFFIILTCLVVTGCGPSEGDRKPMDGKEFMKSFGECPECGKRKIDLFGGEK